MIVIVDYKTANIGSIVNMFKRIGAAVRIAEDPSQLDGASKILLPGIGHFDTCATNLRSAGFANSLHDYVFGRSIPLLGICVGAQLLTLGSEEGSQPGLGWISATTVRFPHKQQLHYKVPHMGWNTLAIQNQHPIFANLGYLPRFYFVHSYYMQCDNPSSVLATTEHGLTFASVITRENLVGVQFHPEKSHRFGMQLLRNFAEWNV